MATKSKQDRWNEAAALARQKYDIAKQKLDEAIAALQDVADPMSTLKGIQEECEEWQGNLPENLQTGALYDKLEAVAGLDIDSWTDIDEDSVNNIGELDDLISECEGAEMPLGFGRD